MKENPNSLIEAKYKLKHPDRNQTVSKQIPLDSLIPQDHRARDVWDFVEKMNLEVCYANITTLENSSGRSTTSPRVLLCLWIYSIIDGNISARKLEELCEYHSVYQWIAGGVPINRTMLAEFRSQYPDKFEVLLTECLVAMRESGVLTDTDFSQDGTKVKANAGTNSFRREPRLNLMHEEVENYIKELEIASKKDAHQYETRETNRKKQYAQKRSEKVQAAIKNLSENKKKG